MNNYILSIVIPTVEYSLYFEKTLQSCFNLKLAYEFEIVVSVNNRSYGEFSNSRYFNNAKITWNCIERETIPMADSINEAIKLSTGEWIFILSDDDIILPNFLQNIDLLELSNKSLYATRINIINEDDDLIRENKSYDSKIYNQDEALELFFQNKIHNHISLLVFHKSLLIQIGGFKLMGYPNGYYIDTVFHGKALANCDFLYTSENIVFSRRESSTQGSSKFYFDKEVNNYFKIIVNDFFNNKNFREKALKKYKRKECFYRRMIQNRFYTEWTKLNKPIYNKSLTKKIIFFYKYLLYWNTGTFFKLYSFVYILRFEILKRLPQSIKNKLKKLLGR